MSKKSLDRILRDVDEREESLDNEVVEEKPEKAEAKAAHDPDPTDPDEPVGDAGKDGLDDTSDDKKDGLPPWMHARVKGATEAKSAAEKRAEDAEARAKALEQQMQQLAEPEYYEEPTLDDYLGTYQQKQDRAIKDTQIALSRQMAEGQFGAEEVARALDWAKDRCSADPQFNQMMWASNVPAFDAIKEFRKAQSLSELDQYGGDINKLVEARMAAQGGVQTDQAPSQQGTQRTKLPGNFATANNSGGSRSGPAWSGPKPLGDLLKS